MEMTFCVPCLFGLEGLAGDELRRMDMKEVTVQDGRVLFKGTARDMVRANIGLRCGERVLIQLGTFDAPTFDALFEGTKALPWEAFIPPDGAFPVKGHSLDSALHSIPDCQKIVKKAVADRLSKNRGGRLPETGSVYQIQFAIMKDRAVLYLDTTGPGLHKRGYRPAHVAAPLRETLAAGMVRLSGYRGRGDFCDPFCGSGTLAIEAALAAKNRAPGLMRTFAAQQWNLAPAALWEEVRQEAREKEFSGDYRIFASDIDPRAVAMSRENARRAGVEDLIEFSVADATAFDRDTERGVIVTNPPYGERIMEKSQAEALYRGFGAALGKTKGWELYLLSSHTEFERSFGAAADKKRKLYNGMIKCDLFIYKKIGRVGQ